jgi:hypothetical protein
VSTVFYQEQSVTIAKLSQSCNSLGESKIVDNEHGLCLRRDSPLKLHKVRFASSIDGIEFDVGSVYLEWLHSGAAKICGQQYTSARWDTQRF